MGSRSVTSAQIGHGLRMVSTTASTWQHTVTMDNLNPAIKTMEYAVRGPLVIRATEIEKELQSGVKKPFENVIKANIGDAHAMGNLPVIFLRQVLAIVSYPELLNSADMPEDAKDRARAILSGCKGGSAGSYSDSPGVEIIRRHVAEYIQERDGGVPADWQNVILCAGASEGIRGVMKLLTNPNGGDGEKRPGVMIPIPQYPLYSASLAEYNMDQVGYYLDEDKNWSLDMAEIERAYNAAASKCAVRAIVIINPGNPTGNVLSRANIEAVVKFAEEKKLFVFADEVYQDNVYADGCKFHSFKKVMSEMGAPYNSMELASFMSCSKGYMGECGIRGGYAEVVNMDPDVKAMLMKSISAKLCPTVIGQWRDSPAKSSRGPCMLFHAFICRQRPLQRPNKWVKHQMCFMHSNFWRTRAFASYLAPGLVNDQTPITSVRQFYRRKMHWSVCWAVLRLFMRILLRNMLTRVL